MTIVEEAVLVYRNERVGKHPSFEATRTAIIHAIRKCAEIAESLKDHGCGDCLFGCEYDHLSSVITAEILRAAGLSEEKKNG